MDLQAIAQDQNPWWREPAARAARSYPVRRDLQPRLLEALLRPEERRGALVIGPRQVGKTVLLLQLADDLLDEGLPPAHLTYFDFSDDRVTDEVSPRQVAEIRPVDLEEGRPRVFLFDEIRLGKSWDRWLKQAVDRQVGRIVATDSAASLLREAGRESGQGRWDEHRIEGLAFREFARLHGPGEDDVERIVRRLPNLGERYLALGGFPEYALSEDLGEVRRRLRSAIIARAIFRGLIGFAVDLPRVRHLFVSLMRDSGALFNATQRADELGADPRTTTHWLELLEDTLLVVRLPKYAEQATARSRAQPRICAADPGLVTAFSSLPDRDEDVPERVFKAAVFRHLRTTIHDRGGDLSFYRRAEDEEIDFVFERADTKVAVEVTSSSRLRSRRLDRLRRAALRLGADRSILIHGGLVEETVEGIEAVPIRRFLLNPELVIGAEEER